MSTSRTIRVFLSSTFRDFAEERDLLVRTVFPELRRKCRERQVELVDVDLRWGITEKEAQKGKVLPICLAEIDRSRPYFIGCLAERYGWIPAKEKYDVSLLVEQPWLEAHLGSKSVTELEILHGVLNNPAMAGQAFFYFRDPRYAQKKGAAYLSAGQEEKAKTEVLKARIRTSGFPVLENYRNPEVLAKRVKEDLWRMIDAAYPQSEVPDALMLERRKHESYGASRLRLYLGGERYFKMLDSAMSAKNFAPVLVTGQSGGGKSALLANWLNRWSIQHPEAAVVVHHLGSGADAADPVRMVVRLIREIAKLTGEEFQPESDPEKQLEQLPLWLAAASAWAQRCERELLLVLDGLDKLSDRKHLRWFPVFLPPKVKLVASCLDGEILQAAEGRFKWKQIMVRPFVKTAQKRLIKEYLWRFRKSLTPEQSRLLQSHPLSGNPLFLLTVLEELRVFGVHEEVEQRLATLLSPPPSKKPGEEPTVDDAFEHVLARIEEDIGRRRVQRAMEAIWASRAGLFSDELLGIAKLAPAHWAAIQNALDESLYEGGGRIHFGHDYVRKAVEDRYGLRGRKKRRLHWRLAEWFARWEVDERIAEELPWQWREAGDKEALCRCLLEREVFECCYDRDEYELLAYWLWTRKDIEAQLQIGWVLWNEVLDTIARDLQWKIGAFLRCAGYYSDFTEMLLRLSLKDDEEAHGEEHFDTLVSVNNLGILLEDRSDFEEAEALYRRALEGREKTLGTEHPDTLVSLNALGNLHHTRGDYDGAETLLRRALEGRERALGAEHPDTLVSANDLGVLLRDRGDFTGAETFLQRALEGRKKSLGSDHLDTLGSMGNLGGLFYTIGNFDGAEVLYRRVLNGKEKALGPDHRDTVMMLNNLAIIISEKHQYKAAESLYRRAIIGLEKALGVGHPSTLLSVTNLGNLLYTRGETFAAEKLLRRALEGREKVFGPDHPETLMSLDSLGNVLFAKGDNLASEAMHQRALEGRNKTFGSDHPETLNSVSNLAFSLFARDRVSAKKFVLSYIAGTPRARSKLHYTLACFAALEGDVAHAKSFIVSHLNEYPENRLRALADRDLESIHSFIDAL